MSNSRLRVQRRKPSHEEPAHLTATTQDRQMGPPPVSPIAANAAPLQVTAQRASPSLSSLGHDFSRVSILPPGTDAPSEPLSAPVQRGDHVRIQAAELQWHGLDLPIQRHDNLGQRIRAAQGGGESLGPAVQRSLEARLGADLSSVRVHTGGEADALCRSVDAMAFTTGSDIFFRHGTYNPSASQGFHMLAHEAAHTVQQARGPVAGTPGPGGVSISSPGDAFEREADISASRMMAGEPTHVQRRHSLRSTVGVPVYRLAVTERPVNAQQPPVTSIKELTGGHKGIVFLVENQGGEKLVVKFQNEEPKQALVGTEMLKTAVAITPDVRVAEQGDLANISTALASLPGTFDAMVRGFEDARAKFKFSLVMGFASGQTIMKVMNETPLRLIAALKSRKFQEDLGKILAGDAFSGNPDRMFAGNIDFTLGVTGWYHEQNLFIAETAGEFSAVAIDNAFAPYLGSFTLPYGKYMGNFGLQWGSVAVANKELFKVEVGVIFDRIVKELLKRHPQDANVASELTTVRKDEFVDTVAASGVAALDKLLKRGQEWKKRLTTGGASEKEISEFRVRKRYMRLLGGLKPGGDPKQLHGTATDTRAYRKWVLTTQLMLPPDEADKVLDQGDAAYKQLLKSA